MNATTLASQPRRSNAHIATTPVKYAGVLASAILLHSRIAPVGARPAACFQEAQPPPI